MAIDQQRLESFLDTVIRDLSAGYGGVMVSLGDKLGLYKAMNGAGGVTSGELAERSQCDERYIREWLNSQVAGGYLAYHPHERRYELTPEQALVLADDTSPVFIPPAWQVPASMWFDEQKAVQAFRTGSGVSWGEHDKRLSCGTAAFYRNAYQASLVNEWLPALEGVVEKLDRGIRVADIGCGHGHSTAIMAEAFPNSSFTGFDTHVDSVLTARAHSKRRGIAERLSFCVSDAESYPLGGFDLICFFDCLHDMGDPVAAARYARNALAEDGVLLVVEPFANDNVEDNVTPIGRMYYSASTTICCAHAISEKGERVLGAQAGESRLAEVFDQAGFHHFRCAMRTPFNLVLEVRP